MELMFRGVRYFYQSHDIKGVQKTLSGSYRGQASEWSIYSLPLLSWGEGMCYRGVPLSSSVSSHQLSVKSAKSTTKDLESLHRHYILQRLQQRLMSAQNKGDQQLVQALELEMKISI